MASQLVVDLLLVRGVACRRGGVDADRRIAVGVCSGDGRLDSDERVAVVALRAPHRDQRHLCMAREVLGERIGIVVEVVLIEQRHAVRKSDVQP